MSKILIITGQFVPYTKSLGGILRVYSFIKSLKKKHKIFLLVSKPLGNKNHSYLGLSKKEFKNVEINYITNNNHNLKSSILNYKLLRNIFYLFGLDYAVNLNKKYLNQSLEIIKKNNINNIIVSSPPFSLFFLVKNLKSIFKNIRIILDYRDGWTTRIDNIIIYPFKFIIQNFVEKKILYFADFILTATSQINSKVRDLCKDKKKIILLRNGFLIRPKRKKKINKILRIGYFGLISDDSSSYRNVRIIFDTLKKNKLLQKKFIFEFYGNNDIRANDIKFFKSFKFKKNLDYSKALSKMTEMDYLLIIHTEKSTSKEMVTSKFYDYLASGTQVLNISCGKNEVGEIIKKYNLGKNLNYQKDNIEDFLLNLKMSKKKIIWNKKLYIFNREYQNKKLLKILN